MEVPPPQAGGEVAVEALGMRWQPDESSEVCPSCADGFDIFNRRHHCRFCGRLSCAQCSPAKWEARSLPPHCRRGNSTSAGFRVCRDCVTGCEALKAALRSGDSESLPRLLASNLVARAIIVRDRAVPGERGAHVAHLAAESGSLPMVRMLRSSFRVSVTSVDDRGRTPFAVAVSEAALPLMRWLALCHGARAAEVSDVPALCRAFDVGILGVPPSFEMKKGAPAKLDDFKPDEESGDREGVLVASATDDQSSDESCGGAAAPAASPGARASSSPVMIPVRATEASTSSAAFSMSDCLVCWERPSSYCFVPCGHVVACGVCVDELETSTCPYCRAPVEQRIKAYFPSV